MLRKPAAARRKRKAGLTAKRRQARRRAKGKGASKAELTNYLLENHPEIGS